MNNLRSGQHLILCVAPNATGFGYVVIEPDRNLLDCGVRGFKKRSLPMIRESLDVVYRCYRPGTLLCRQPEPRKRKRTYAKLTEQAFLELAKRERAVHRIVESREIKKYFAERAGTRKKDDVARVVAKVFPELGHMVPAPRRTWMPEQRRMGVFDAASIAIWYCFTSGFARLVANQIETDS